jgi:hypothetical protein
LNNYHDECIDMIRYIPREENKRANALAQQASGYNVMKGMFWAKERQMLSSMCVSDGKSARGGGGGGGSCNMIAE